MFTDIVGSTPLVEALGDDAWQELIRWHDQTLRAIFNRHGGTEVRQTGDGFFVAFEDATEAIEAAVAVQRSLAEHRRGHGFAPKSASGYTRRRRPLGPLTLPDGESTRLPDRQPCWWRADPCQREHSAECGHAVFGVHSAFGHSERRLPARRGRDHRVDVNVST